MCVSSFLNLLALQYKIVSYLIGLTGRNVTWIADLVRKLDNETLLSSRLNTASLAALSANLASVFSTRAVSDTRDQSSFNMSPRTHATHPHPTGSM